MKYRHLLLVLLLSTSTLTSCAWFKRSAQEAKEIVIDCTKDAVKKSVKDLVPTVIAIVLNNGGNWKDQISALVQRFGASVTACALRTAAGLLHQSLPVAGEGVTEETARTQTGIMNARGYIEDQNWKFTE